MTERVTYSQGKGILFQKGGSERAQNGILDEVSTLRVGSRETQGKRVLHGKGHYRVRPMNDDPLQQECVRSRGIVEAHLTPVVDHKSSAHYSPSN